jgi:hypothetical protein
LAEGKRKEQASQVYQVQWNQSEKEVEHGIN